MMKKSNYFMLLINSPWPLILTISIMNFLMSVLIFLSSLNKTLILMSFIILFVSIYYWFNETKMELNKNGLESNNLESTMKLFFIFLVVSEIMIFLSMFWTSYWFYLVPDMMPLVYMNKSIIFFKWFTMPFVNTLILIFSSITVTISHFNLIFNNKKNTINMLILTIMLGMIFSFLQYKEYSNSFFSINDNFIGGVFFMLTGLHGMHVMLGAILLIFSLKNLIKMEEYIMKSEMMEMSSWYWHFVDLIWLFVMYSIYYLNN